MKNSEKILLEKNSIIIFFVIFIATCFIYRIWLSLEITQLPPLFSYIQITLGLATDILVGMFFCLGLYVSFKIPIKNSFFLHLSLIIILTLAFFIYTAQRKLITILSTGLNYSVLLDFVHNYSVTAAYVPFTTYWDWICLTIPWLLYLIFNLIPYRLSLNFITYLLLPTIFIVLSSSMVLSFLITFPLKKEYIQILYYNPILYLVHDLWRNQYNYYAQNKILPILQPQHKIKLSDPLFVNNYLIGQFIHKNQKPAPVNVAIIVLESVGAEFVFKKIKENEIPMPFLKELSQKSIWFTNHYSTGNGSALAGFGILTGLYNNPTPKHFEMRPDLKIPTMATWLGEKYDSRFIAPVNMSFFFPKSLITNSFHILKDYTSIPIAPNKILAKAYIPEPIGFNYLLSECKTLKPPFLVIYWSGAAHMPYFDYGSNYRLLSNINNNYDRYINNLRLLDDEIKQFYQFLQNKKWLDDTLFIIVGDHGQGFGQHVESYMHGTTLYEEQIKVPLLLHHSKSLKPQIINEITTSADILPTALDILNIPFDPTLFQGNSLLRQNSARKTIFIYGDENELATIDNQKNKMIIDFTKGNCRKFDLRNDAKERFPLECFRGNQENAMIAFRNFQSGLLEWLNQKGA